MSGRQSSAVAAALLLWEATPEPRRLVSVALAAGVHHTSLRRALEAVGMAVPLAKRGRRPKVR